MNNVVEVTKDYYLLSDGSRYEHQFDIDDDITPEEFQTLLDNSKKIIDSLMNKNS